MLTDLLLVSAVIGISSSLCPALEPNPNVGIFCSIGQGTNQKHINCAPENGTKIPTGTTAEYQCARYFKSLNRGLIGGQLTCTNNGAWTKHGTFLNFHCGADCGKRPALNELISGGNSTQGKNWPWVATIFRKTKEGKFKYSCGGSLIGRQAILTAAHCVSDERLNKLPINILTIFLATLSSSFEENTKGAAQGFSVKEIHIHPDYASHSLEADIAVIVLSEKVTINGNVQPICLPKSHAHDSLVVVTGNVGEISSFGIDGSAQPARVLQHAHIPIVSSASCHDAINVIPYGDQFCAGDPKGPTICRGDSGSGLTFKSVEWNEEKYFIHGIVSNTGELAHGCATMVIFTKVFSHVSWIYEKLGLGNSNYKLNPRPQGQIRQTHVSEMYTRKERVALRKLRPLVKNILLEDYMHRDEYLIRFLRSKDFNINQVQEALRATMDWRKANRINQILKEDFTGIRKMLPVIFQGFDNGRRPVFVYWFGGWKKSQIRNTAELEHCVRYMTRNFEDIDERIRSISSENITQATVIVDFNGASSEQLCPLCLKMVSTMVQIGEAHYPDQNYISYYINSPAFIDRMLDAILPNLNKHLPADERILGTNKTEWSQILLKQIPADQLFVAYGGTKSIKRGTKRLDLAL